MGNTEMKPGRFGRWAKARQKLAWIEGMLADGRTVYVCTYTRATKITPATFSKWQADHGGLFRATKSGLYMRAGKRWDCIDFCQLKAS